MTAPDAEYFDGWYADMASSPHRDELFRRNLGLPPEFESTSVLPFAGIVEIRDLLALGAESTLLDLACGRGGYGMWLGRETGCRVVGVDFSGVAIRQAVETAASLGQSATTSFQVGSLDACGLPDASVDAVIVIDAIQFAPDISAAAAEIRRVLRPGGRLAVTCWEPLDRSDERLSPRLRAVDLATQLPAGGLAEVHVSDRREWLVTERAMWSSALALETSGDPALVSLRTEAERVLPTIDVTRRVLATGRAPA